MSFLMRASSVALALVIGSVAACADAPRSGRPLRRRRRRDSIGRRDRVPGRRLHLGADAPGAGAIRRCSRQGGEPSRRACEHQRLGFRRRAGHHPASPAPLRERSRPPAGGTAHTTRPNLWTPDRRAGSGRLVLREGGGVRRQRDELDRGLRHRSDRAVGPRSTSPAPACAEWRADDEVGYAGYPAADDPGVVVMRDGVVSRRCVRGSTARGPRPAGRSARTPTSTSPRADEP